MHIGNPSDTELLRPAIDRITTLLGDAPTLLTADRGYWDSTIEADLTAVGVTTIVIPRTGKPSTARARIEHTDTFVDAVKWRTGSEGRVSAVFYTKLHHRLLGPLLEADHPPAPTDVRHALATIDHAISHYITNARLGTAA